MTSHRHTDDRLRKVMLRDIAAHICLDCAYEEVCPDPPRCVVKAMNKMEFAAYRARQRAAEAQHELPPPSTNEYIFVRVFENIVNGLIDAAGAEINQLSPIEMVTLTDNLMQNHCGEDWLRCRQILTETITRTLRPTQTTML